MNMREIDKSELILESYRITGISDAQCRSIFLDWLLKLPDDVDQMAAVRVMINTYGLSQPDHPMTKVLHTALDNKPETRRRGGRTGRLGP